MIDSDVYYHGKSGNVFVKSSMVFANTNFPFFKHSL